MMLQATFLAERTDVLTIRIFDSGIPRQALIEIWTLTEEEAEKQDNDAGWKMHRKPPRA